MSTPLTRLNARRLDGATALVCALAATTGAIVADLTLSSPTTGDHVSSAPVAGDNAGPAIDALVHGHFATLVSHQPLMGLTSILLRLPLAVLSRSRAAMTCWPTGSERLRACCRP